MTAPIDDGRAGPTAAGMIGDADGTAGRRCGLPGCLLTVASAEPGRAQREYCSAEHRRIHRGTDREIDPPEPDFLRSTGSGAAPAIPPSGGATRDGPSPPGDHPAPPGDDPTPPGDDPTPAGDDPAPPGDGPPPPGDHPAPPGDDPSPPGEDAPRAASTAADVVPTVVSRLTSAPAVATGEFPVVREPNPCPPSAVAASPVEHADASTRVLSVPMPAAAPRGRRRASLSALTGGLLDPSRRRAARHRAGLVERLRRREPGTHHIAVVSMKGGVGKTTVSACLGLVFAELRPDRIVGLDANPDAGTLAERLVGAGGVTVNDLLGRVDRVQTWSDLARFVHTAERLGVLGSGQDPKTAGSFTADEYLQVTSLLDRFYNIIITDSGTGMVHSAMEATLKTADSLVVVGSPTVDGATRAGKTLDWLDAHGHSDLAGTSVAALVLDRVDGDVDIDRVREHFEQRCRAVVDIPADPHLARGDLIYLDQLRRGTHHAFLELAAQLADRFDLAA